jgi:hypothetical protein
MKKVALIVVLAALILSEIYFCTTFLPTRWQFAMSTTIARILPKAHDQWDITHPALDMEIGQVIRNNPNLRVAFYSFLVLLLAGNTLLLVWVWRLVGRARQDRVKPQE